MTTPAGRKGLFSSLKNLTATLLDTVGTRMELLANEFEAQKLQALRMVLLAQAMLFCATVGLLLLVVLAALLWWDQRIAVVGVSAALFVVATLLCLRALKQIVDAPEKPFAATVAELRRDLESLKLAGHHAKTPD
ncbi:MAG: phage holin family protein [Burkholderiaceae bacterium]